MPSRSRRGLEIGAHLGPPGAGSEHLSGYPWLVVDTLLGLLGLVVFVVCVISLAAGVTFVVVKLIPADRSARKESSA
jgi:hypothetical protein